MGRLRDWWDRVTGRAPAAAELRQERAPQASARTDPKPSAGLSLVDEPPKQKTSRTGQPGFDPYSSDAGYAKPHSWERVDHD
jgi:hypothetical protein